MSKNVPQKINPDPDPADDPQVHFDKADETEVVTEVAGESLEFDQLKAAHAESEKRTLMAVADLENFRKRANKNAQEQVKYASLPMMNELLESVDNLNRAVEAAENENPNSALLEGVKMVADQILNILKANHCEPIAAIGQPFDPNLHEAVQMQNSDEFSSNTVMMEVRTGYVLYDRVIRPAQVFVSTGPANHA